MLFNHIPMKISLETKEIFPVSAQELYEAFLSSEQHTAMTGGEVEVDSKGVGHFTACDGYIHTEIPSGQTDYEQAWEDHYFTSMRMHLN